ncbi:MAG: ferric reductase-like transmembrane domain-containing protein [Gammaproteobacteria bacterium]|nr:ferric reductase-like transmembrane domain-containing protein [Gammaproteobacteria bacterium]
MVLNLLVWIVVFAPLITAIISIATGQWVEPLTAAITISGYSALCFYLASLAARPLAKPLRTLQLMRFRRRLGVTSFAYAVLHLVLHGIDLGGVAGLSREVLVRPFLALGFVATVGLTVLAVTSLNSLRRRLGRSWQSLHRTTHLLAALITAHYVLAQKVITIEQWLVIAVVAALLVHRK